MAILDELRRRNVHRVALAYLAGAWLLIQIADTLFPTFELSTAANRILVIILAISFVPALILAWKFEWTPQGIQRDADVVRDSAAPTSRLVDRAIAVTLAIAVTYFAIDKFWPEPLGDLEDSQSIIVIPFENVGSDPEQDVLAEGFAMDLLTLLSNIDELRVVPSATSATFAKREIDIGDIGDMNTDFYRPIKSDPRWERMIRVRSTPKTVLRDVSYNPEYPEGVLRILEEIRAETTQ